MYRIAHVEMKKKKIFFLLMWTITIVFEILNVRF